MDTICAISTAVGESAIGIVRLSGADTEDILQRVFKPRHQEGFEPWRMVYGHVVSEGKVIDEGLAVFFKGPRSYTREDMAEIHCHGGPVALKRVLGAVLRAGCRQAEPGEFTKRAFLSGRLDLSQAESIMDVIQAKTDLAFDTALQQLSGGLSRIVGQLRAELFGMVTHLAVNIDYPEEDITEITYEDMEPAVSRMEETLKRLLQDAGRGRILREGLKVALIGRPNVGKSSLMNALLQEERAIVTHIPGTTRDVIEEYLNVRGIPVRLMDTAGIRETDDPVERIGVQRSRTSYQEADLILTVLDSSEPMTPDDRELLSQVGDRPALVILNKADLPPAMGEGEILQLLPRAVVIRTSTVGDIGLMRLEEAIEAIVTSGQAAGNYSFVTNVRHQALLEEALIWVTEVSGALDRREPYDLIEMELRSIHDLLGRITGETVSEDLINAVFSQFCLGK